MNKIQIKLELLAALEAGTIQKKNFHIENIFLSLFDRQSLEIAKEIIRKGNT